MYNSLVEIHNKREFARLEKMLCGFAFYALGLFEGNGGPKGRMCHLNGRARGIRKSGVVGTRMSMSFISKDAFVIGGILGHIFAAKHTKTADLHSMFAWLYNDDSGLVFCLGPGYDVSDLNLPGVESPFYRGIPGPKSGFWVDAWGLGDMDEGISEKTGATLDIVVWLRLESDDFYGERKGVGEEQFSGTGLRHVNLSESSGRRDRYDYSQHQQYHTCPFW